MVDIAGRIGRENINWDNDFEKYRALCKQPRDKNTSQIEQSKFQGVLTMHAFNEEIQIGQANISLQQRWLLVNKE